jgi:hypothetical protein
MIWSPRSAGIDIHFDNFVKEFRLPN